MLFGNYISQGKKNLTKPYAHFSEGKSEKMEKGRHYKKTNSPGNENS